MSEGETFIVWFDRDLRLADNCALSQACRRADRVLPLYIARPATDGWPINPTQLWWLRRSLERLDERLRDHGSRLIVRRGKAREVLCELAQEVGAAGVFWNQRYRPSLRQRDEQVAEALEQRGVHVETFAARLLHEPDQVRTTTGGPYHVFTPFWRKFRKLVDVGQPLGAAELGADQACRPWPASQSPAALTIGTTEQARQPGGEWTPGEQGARRRLDAFVERGLSGYEENRDRPDRDGTSRLSVHLRFGELSPRQVWQAVRDSQQGRDDEVAEAFLRQLVWREFSYHLLYHYPHTDTEPLRDKFRGFRWCDDPDWLERWHGGQTGYPLVDAGMRQLLETGWMHNRLRMVVASFLTKDLLIPWQQGARWFWERLVDADLANNTMGWQWAAGCGADAQPFFRIFNPLTQSTKFDPAGEFIRRFVPELDALDAEHIHAPWRAPDEALSAAGVELGRDYPEPIVDHGRARQVALERYEEIK